MLRWFTANKLRVARPRRTLTRSRSTATASPSFLEARDRVRELARNIGRPSVHNSVAPCTGYVPYIFAPFILLIVYLAVV
jgi:hypothetical protein